jgi:prephenate dehydrogenase
MAGSHLQGLEHASAELYRGRVAILTPTAATLTAAIDLVEQLWRAVGSRVVRMDPDLHDRAVAEASHLPHLLACAAAAQLGDGAAPLCAGGFRDTTRVAGSSPAMWAEILATNAAAVGDGIDATIERLHQLRAALMRGDQATVERWLGEGHAGRERYERATRPG